MRKFKLPFELEPVEDIGDVDFFPCYVMGEPWRYGLVTKKQMKELSEGVSGEADGLCDGITNTIFIAEGCVNHPTILHELCHAFMNQTQVASASLTADQVEEVMCDIFAASWCRILLLARVMVHNLLCYEDYIKGGKTQDWEECPADLIDRRLPERLLDLVATYSTTGGSNPLLKAIVKKKRRVRSRKSISFPRR